MYAICHALVRSTPYLEAVTLSVALRKSCDLLHVAYQKTCLNTEIDGLKTERLRSFCSHPGTEWGCPPRLLGRSPSSLCCLHRGDASPCAQSIPKE